MDLATITPSAASRDWARRYGLDARVIELAITQSRRIVRRKRGVLITETRHGLICANSAVDVSNVDGGRHALLLPRDPDRSAARIHAALEENFCTFPSLSSSQILSEGHGGKGLPKSPSAWPA